MNVLVTGSSGLVGSALVPSLVSAGHRVIRLVRGRAGGGSEGQVPWDPDGGALETAALEGYDVVVHLAGETIAERWSAEKKARIRDSRVRGTRLLCETLARLSRPPQTLVSASAIGYYGNRGEEILQEDSPAGSGFLTEVCQEWEAQTEAASRQGIRVVMPRIGVVLSPAGGALQQMLLPFRMGLGGKVGSGRQYMSWIALDDLIGAIHHALSCETLQGAVNAVAPNPVTNLEFTKALGKALSRPTIAPMPSFAARLAFGEMADALLLASTRVVPGRLQSSGFNFRYPEILPALRHLLQER